MDVNPLSHLYSDHRQVVVGRRDVLAGDHAVIDLDPIPIPTRRAREGDLSWC